MTNPVAGTCDRAFAGVRELFEHNLAEGRDRGAAVAVFVGGRPVVDLWGGVADHKTGRNWERDTPCVAFSSTKGVTATAALMVAEEYGLDLAKPVVDWWPEFGAADKADTTGEDLFAHRAGLPVLEQPVTVAEAGDPAAMAARLAAQTPLWEPGTKHGYHALTFGWLVGELVRRHTGGPVGEYVRERIGSDLWIGASPEVLARAARIGYPPAAETAWKSGTAVPPTSEGSRSANDLPAAIQRLAAAYRDPDSLMRRSTANPAGSHNDPAVLAGGWPASGMVTTARALATCYRDLVRGDLLRPDHLREAIRERVRGADEVLCMESAFALGFMRPSANFPVPRVARAGAFGHPGHGGSLGFGDLDNDLAIAFIPNLLRDGLAGDRRAHDLVAAVYAAL